MRMFFFFLNLSLVDRLSYKLLHLIYNELFLSKVDSIEIKDLVRLARLARLS